MSARSTLLRLMPAVAAVVVVLLAGGARAESQFTRETDIDRSGNDMAVVELSTGTTADDCAARCSATKGCVAFTYVKQSTTVPKPVCRLKDEAPYGHESSCCISGTRKN